MVVLGRRAADMSEVFLKVCVSYERDNVSYERGTPAGVWGDAGAAGGGAHLRVQDPHDAGSGQKENYVSKHYVCIADPFQSILVEVRIFFSQSDIIYFNLLARIYFIIEIILWTGLAPWGFKISFPGSLISTFLVGPSHLTPHAQLLNAPLSRESCGLGQEGWRGEE